MRYVEICRLPWAGKFLTTKISQIKVQQDGHHCPSGHGCNKVSSLFKGSANTADCYYHAYMYSEPSVVHVHPYTVGHTVGTEQFVFVIRDL